MTEKARKILFPKSDKDGFDESGRPFEVIPCCVDLNRFETANEQSRAEMRRRLKIEDRFAAVYVGSFGGWYMTRETADFYGELKKKKPDAFALILTQSDPQLIQPLLEERGFTTADFLITQVAPPEIPLYLSAADVAISFIKPCYSKQASSPTKNAEYLACGLPIIVNDGVGDTTELTEADGTGVVINEFNAENYQVALAKLETLLEDKNALSARCRESARKRFDLVNVGGAKYRHLYQRILSKD